MLEGGEKRKIKEERKIRRRSGWRELSTFNKCFSDDRTEPQDN